MPTMRPTRGKTLSFQLLHGGQRPARRTLQEQPVWRHNFGPGLYMTENRHVAAAYVSQNGGAIHQIEVSGPADGILDCDRDLALAQRLPRYIHQLLPDLELGGTRYDQLAALHGPYYDDHRYRRLNVQLLAFGFWMITGHVGGSSCSGYQDRGRQFVLLDHGCIDSIESFEKTRTAA